MEKIALVTGAYRGIGFEICRQLAEKGIKVILSARNEETGKIAAEKLNVIFHQLDITNEVSIEKIKDFIEKKFGKLDILINNAGVSTFEAFEERPEESFDLVMDTNLKGTFFCIQSYVDHFDKTDQSKGAIVNVGSFYGVISPDYRIYSKGDRQNSEVYGATKAGVIQMTKYFGVHLAERNIRVNCVSPGGIFNPDNPQQEDFIEKYSQRCPMGRMADTEEMVGAILYLSSNAANYTTGHNLIVDGGMSIW
ncbi:MAG: SDR family oxidoreductase [Bacteroidetes bacterium]|nr:SDR family oxidoreductase [Bacteroidota bacterium]